MGQPSSQNVILCPDGEANGKTMMEESCAVNWETHFTEGRGKK
jgi:hypothetical protein